MKIEVDYGRCTGHGVCETLAEDLFKLDDDGVMHLLEDAPSEGRRAVVHEAVQQCPAKALSISD